MTESVIPLNKMVDYNGNFYEMTNAMVKRADALTKHPENLKEDVKICSEAIREILDGEVEFSTGDE